MAQVLLDLASLITSAARTIDAVCKSRKTTFPSLDDPVDPTSGAIRHGEQVARAIEVLVASAEQILATAWDPARYVLDMSLSFHVSAALRDASVVNVAESLRTAGPTGLHVKDIVEGTCVDPAKIARILRLLATRHVFREVAPDVFANNGPSSLLDTGKPLTELRANHFNKFDDTTVVSATLETATDEYMKAAGYLAEVVALDPAKAHSDSPSDAAMCAAHKIDAPGSYWTWLAEPEQSVQLRRFGVAIEGFAKVTASEEHMIKDFGWRDLPEGAIVVDVGGGIGHASMALAKAFPRMKLVMQDSPRTVQHGREFWSTTLPSALESGRVELQAHDFFHPQPARSPPASVYLLRFVLHDWADSLAAQILRHLRDTAAATTKLIVIERVLLYACKSADVDQVEGAPGLLLPNLGAVSLNGYLMDLHMMTGFNGQERTLRQFERMFAEGGWNLKHVSHAPGFASMLVCTPRELPPASV